MTRLRCAYTLILFVWTSAFYVCLDSGCKWPSFVRGREPRIFRTGAFVTRYCFNVKQKEENARRAKKKYHESALPSWISTCQRWKKTKIGKKKNPGIRSLLANPRYGGDRCWTRRKRNRATTRTASGRIRPFRCGELNLDRVFRRPGAPLSITGSLRRARPTSDAINFDFLMHSRPDSLFD